MTDVKLKVLIIDNSDSSGNLLLDSLAALRGEVLSVRHAPSLSEAEQALSSGETFNTIFVDPVTLGLGVASKFIFKMRKERPSIVFVLYFDFNAVPAKGTFYAGERVRFKHYHTLNKAIPAAMFRNELLTVVAKNQDYLRRFMKAHELQELQAEIQRIEGESASGTAAVPLALLTEMRDQIGALKARLMPPPPSAREGTVFLSHRFAESEYVEGLKTLLCRDGFEVVTGENASGYISRSILERIGATEFFLCLMTRHKEKTDGTFTTSPWLLEEKGAAIAMNKKIVLMVEEGVSDIGGLQGDWQRIHFTARGFTMAALRAIEQLKTYIG